MPLMAHESAQLVVNQLPETLINQCGLFKENVHAGKQVHVQTDNTSDVDMWHPCHA